MSGRREVPIDRLVRQSLSQTEMYGLSLIFTDRTISLWQQLKT
jgi:hypothetical protein